MLSANGKGEEVDVLPDVVNEDDVEGDTEDERHNGLLIAVMILGLLVTSVLFGAAAVEID